MACILLAIIMVNTSRFCSLSITKSAETGGSGAMMCTADEDEGMRDDKLHTGKELHDKN